jgi:hypothetical protein
VTSRYIPQLSFSFYRHRAIRADFSGGQITSDAGLLPWRAFDQRHGLTRDLSKWLRDLREDERVRHSVLSLFRQRLYQIITGYEDANDADRLRHDPAFQILADQPLVAPLGSQPTLSRWENSSPRDLFSARLICEDLWETSPQTRRDPARCRFHRRSNVRTTAASLTVVLTSTCITPC